MLLLGDESGVNWDTGPRTSIFMLLGCTEGALSSNRRGGESM